MIYKIYGNTFKNRALSVFADRLKSHSSNSSISDLLNSMMIKSESLHALVFDICLSYICSAYFHAEIDIKSFISAENLSIV